MHAILLILVFHFPNDTKIAMKQFPTMQTCQAELDNIFTEINKEKPPFGVTGTCADMMLEVPRGA